MATSPSFPATQAEPTAMQFGSAVRISSGSSKTPGAFSLTWVDVRREEAEEVKLAAAAVAAELANEPGFISWTGMEIGSRLYTITAWEGNDAVRAVMRNSTHQAAVRRFVTGTLGSAASTSVWRADHINGVWVRCPGCDSMIVRSPQGGSCSCGEPLPEAPESW